MNDKFPRKPFSNFFIKKDLQFRLVTKIVVSVLLATAIFAATLLLMYQLSYSSAAFYQVTLAKDSPEIGDRLNIISIILPSLLISAVVNVILAIFVGLYASRKYAVPIYKLEQWASLLLEGKLNAKLRFREQDEMKELSDKCNQCTDQMRERLLEIKKLASTMSTDGVTSTALQTIHEILNSVELESETIEVHTALYPPSGKKRAI